MANEWEIDFDTMLSDTMQTIEKILEWEDVSDNQYESEKLNYELI